MKKINLLWVVLFGINALAFGQFKTPEWYYKQIPPIPDSLHCSSQAKVEGVYNRLEVLAAELDTIIGIMQIDVSNLTESQINTYLDAFPSSDDFDKLESMSEEEQQVYAAELDTKLNKPALQREINLEKYEEEKLQLDISFKEYWEGLQTLITEYQDIAKTADDKKFEKNQEVRRNIDAGDEASAIQQERALEKNKVEFCQTVSPSVLAILEYKWNNIEELTRIVKRNISIEFMSTYYLSEEDMKGEFNSITQIIDYEVLKNYITDYMDTITGSLPGSLSNR